MGNDLNVNNNLLKSLNSSVMSDQWLENLAGTKKSEASAELKKVFTTIASNDVSESDKKALENRAKKLVSDMQNYEKEMKKYEKEILKNQEKIDECANEMQTLVSSVEGKVTKLENEQKDLVKKSIDDVFALYQSGKIGKDAIAAEISNKIRAGSANLTEVGDIDDILDKLDSKQASMQAIANVAATALDSRNKLNRKYTTAASAYNLLNKTINQMSNFSTSFTNSDSDRKVPVYSLEKTELAAKLFANEKYNVPSTNTDYVEGSDGTQAVNTFNNTNEAAIKAVYDKYSQYYSTKSQVAAGKDSYRADTNPAIVNLGKAIDAGMLNDMLAAGMSVASICNVVATNFSAANLKYDDKIGKMSIPYGHDAGSRETFTKLNTFIVESETQAKYLKDISNEKAGNRIDSNAQLKALSENYSTIMNMLDSNGFTFKESMYLLFNQNSGLFKDCGVSYAPGDSAVTIASAGDDSTAKFFNSLAEKINKDYSDNTGKSKVDNANAQDKKPTTEQIDVPAPTVKRTDPIGFNIGNTEYVFTIDRNSDGNFSSATEFVGATGNWLEDLKTFADENGIIKGDALKNVKLLSSNYKETNKTNSSTTNINYAIVSAADLGIEEINLNGLENQVNNSTGKYDVNNSEIFSDTFSFKMNGQTINAQRKDDTSEFMKTVYSAAYGKKLEVGLSEDEAEKAINETNSNPTSFSYGQTVAGLNMIKNAGKISDEVQTMFNQVLNRIEAENNQEITKAVNKAASYSNRAGWSATRNQIQSYAAAAGVSIDMEQAKGLYMTDDSLSAKDIFNQLVNDDNEAKANAKQAEMENEAWKSIVLCLKNGITTTPAKALELLTSGKANTAEDIVELLKPKEEVEE